MPKNQHVVPHKGKWGVRGAGNSRVTAIADTQGDAIDIARDIARNQGSEVVIHRLVERRKSEFPHQPTHPFWRGPMPAGAKLPSHLAVAVEWELQEHLLEPYLLLDVGS